MTEAGKAQEDTGRLEEAVGALSGDEQRAREGRKDQAGEKIRDSVDDVTGAVRRQPSSTKGIR